MMVPYTKVSIRAGKLVHETIFQVIQQAVKSAPSFGEVEKYIFETFQLNNGESSVEEDSSITSVGEKLSFSSHLCRDEVEKVLFGASPDGYDDDDNLPLDYLIISTLKMLSSDVRASVAHNIIFAGGTNLIPGLSDLLLQKLRDHSNLKSERIRAIQSMGAWTGLSLYVSSVAWHNDTKDHNWHSGEISRDKYLRTELKVKQKSDN